MRKHWMWLVLTVCALLYPSFASAQLASWSGITLSPSGRPVSANVAVCSFAPGLATTAASVNANIAILTMASNPITAGFVANQQIIVSGFTGGDTYFNGGSLTNGAIINGFTILSVTSTQITYALVHANASASSNGSAFQSGSAAQACAPLASIFSDPAGATPITQPGLTSSGIGNVNFYVNPGSYAVQYYGSGVVPYIQPLTLTMLFGNNNTVYVNGGSTTVQAAINALPVGTPGGGTVVIAPGTYACPTSLPQGVTLVNSVGWYAPTAPPQIWSKFNGAAFNSLSSGTGSQNMVKFTGCTLNLTDVSQIAILGIVLDYGGTSSMTISGVSWSQFAMAVVNCVTTAPCVTYKGDTTNSFNSSMNRFYWLITEGGNVGLSAGNASTNFATDTIFEFVLVLVDAQPTGSFTAVQFIGNCDSNIFQKISVFATNAITSWKGIVFNSTSTTAENDANVIHILWYDELSSGSAASPSILLNPSHGNTFRTGFQGGGVSITSWSGTTTYTWDNVTSNALTTRSLAGIASLSGPSNLLASWTAPTVTAGFNTGSILANSNGPVFQVSIGSGAAGSTGTVGLPTAAHFWTCWANNVSRADQVQMTSSTNNSATFTNFGTTYAATNWTNGDTISMWCVAF